MTLLAGRSSPVTTDTDGASPHYTTAGGASPRLMHPKEPTLNAPANSTTCTCGARADIYADDERTPLCGSCFLKIYYPELRDEARDA